MQVAKWHFYILNFFYIFGKESENNIKSIFIRLFFVFFIAFKQVRVGSIYDKIVVFDIIYIIKLHFFDVLSPGGGALGNYKTGVKYKQYLIQSIFTLY